MCRLWPAVSPHGPEVPTSIWNLHYGVWVGLATETDAHHAAMREQEKT